MFDDEGFNTKTFRSVDFLCSLLGKTLNFIELETTLLQSLDGTANLDLKQPLSGEIASYYGVVTFVICWIQRAQYFSKMCQVSIKDPVVCVGSGVMANIQCVVSTLELPYPDHTDTHRHKHTVHVCCENELNVHGRHHMAVVHSH